MTLVFAVMRLSNICFFKFLLLLSIPILYFFFFFFFLNLVLVDRRNVPRCQRVLALCAFFNGGDAEGTGSSKVLCSVFVYVLFCVDLGQD